MTTSQAGSILIASVAAVAVAACSKPAQQATQTSPQPLSQQATVRRGDPAGIAKAKADSLRHPYTEADVHFMSAMIGHHAQAIVMAGWAPTHGASPAVLTLAERIINAQKDEILTMQQWLADRSKPVPEAKPGPMKMMMNGEEHEMLMPGMLTDEQMKELDAARGPQFDSLFLTRMIQHHNGAVSMVKDLFGSYGAAQDELVFKFASDVNVDQTTEIARMERMLVSVVLEKRSQ